MNDLTNFQGGMPMNSNDILAGLETMNEGIGASTTSGVPIMRMGKNGGFVYGQEDIEVQPGSHWAINIRSMQHGWACWGEDGEGLIDEVYVPFNMEKPARGTLSEQPYPWKPAYKVMMMCLNGEDEGTIAEYKTTSLGGQDYFRALVQAIMSHTRQHPDEVVPIVILRTDTYKGKHGLQNKPVLDVVRFATEEAMGADPEEKPEEQQKELPPAEEPPPKAAKKRKPLNADKPAAGEASADSKADEPTTKTRRRRAV